MSAALFVLLAAFTLTTQDGGEIAPRILSAVLFCGAAVYVGFRRSLRFPFPVLCLLCLPCYGAIETLCFPRKIVYTGWSAVVFWLAGAAVALVTAQVFNDGNAARRFRQGVAIFGSSLAVLDLLQQASRTNKYFWFIPSSYDAIFASFAYWNNFAEFIELAFPITLWAAFARKRVEPIYLLLAAVQLGSIAACGSRTGIVLLLLELIAFLCLLFLRRREKPLLVAGTALIVLSILFVFAAGFGTVAQKFGRSDQLAVRRDIYRSTFAMIREHPLTGWGLDTFVPVYRQFALYDDGSFVNRAHSDWLQWTAEGGIFFTAFPLAVFVWSFRPAVRSLWGLGVLALCLHAAVDYPFARLGVCGWYFAIIGMLAGGRRESNSRTHAGDVAPGD